MTTKKTNRKKQNRITASNTHPITPQMEKSLKANEFPINKDKLAFQFYYANDTDAIECRKRYDDHFKKHGSISGKFDPAPSFKTTASSRTFVLWQLQNMMDVADETPNFVDMKTVISKAAMEAAACAGAKLLMEKGTIYKSWDATAGEYPPATGTDGRGFKLAGTTWLSFLIFGNYLPKLKLAKYVEVYRANLTEKAYTYIDFAGLIKAYMEGKLTRGDIEAMYHHDIKYCDDLVRLIKEVAPKVVKAKVAPVPKVAESSDGIYGLDTITVDPPIKEYTGEPNSQLLELKKDLVRTQLSMMLQQTADAIPDLVARKKICGGWLSVVAVGEGIKIEEAILGWGN